MESSVETLMGLLENWSSAGTRVHLSFTNNWEGWKFDGFESLDSVKLSEGVLALVIGGWALSFSVDRFKRVSIVNPLESSEGISLPESAGIERVAYVSDKAVFIDFAEEGGKESHSYFAIAKMMDDNSFAKA
jgi:hypothetical protein